MRLHRNLYLLPRFLRSATKKENFHSTARFFVLNKNNNNNVEPPKVIINSNNNELKPAAATTQTSTSTMSTVQLYELVHKLSENERESLRQALNQFELDQMKVKFEGELAGNRWRPRFTEKHGIHGDLIVADYCALPDDFAKKNKSDAATLTPTKQELSQIMLVNAIPFLGFGFLDNFFMIIAGDSIEHTMGMYMCISTMAAAGFGNTISDVMGLGLAHYVEKFCEFLGMRPPKLTAEQLEMGVTRRVAAYGRALGITIGCLLGMCPLWFIKKKLTQSDKDDSSPDKELIVAKV